MSAVPEFNWSPNPRTERESWFETAPVPMAQCQRTGNITVLNPSLEHALGWKFKAGRVRFLHDLFSTEDREESERLFRGLFAGECENFQLDSMVPSGKKLRWIVWRVRGRNGEPDFALAIAQYAIGHDAIERGSISHNPGNDHSTSTQAEQRLRQAQKLEAVGRLAGGVAHDFNNLLTGVLLYCDLLSINLEPENPANNGHVLNTLTPNQLTLSHADLASRLRKYVDEIRKAGLQATGVVRQLLAVARPASGEPTLVSLNEIADGMRNLLSRLIGENIELGFQLDAKLGLVKMDPAEAQQILLNLVLNARDAMPGGGRVTVETSSCKVQVLAENQLRTREGANLPCALFVVSDNGNGMDDATRAHLFEAFFTTKAADKGTGLGLATVYDTVTRNGGLIHVDSIPGRGTRVNVLLPLVPEALNSPPESTSPADSDPESETEMNIESTRGHFQQKEKE